MKACEECGHVERIFYVCPACGVSFEVSSPTSARIFCGRCKRAGAASVRCRSGESLRTDGKTQSSCKTGGLA